MTRDCNEASFLHDVRDHKVTIARDDGLYRHLQCKKPDSYCMSYDIVTYPGYLVMSGDMGAWVFTRERCMFGFFRGSGHEHKGETLRVNLSYWAEKLEAVDKSGVKEFDAALFEERVREHVAEWLEGQQPDEPARDAQGRFLPAVVVPEDLAEAIDDLIRAGSEHEYAAHTLLRDFDDKRIEFNDTWEWSFSRYTYRYVWACYAIAWAIREYDKQKEATP